MSRKIVIDPVTRIEGHAKISIQLDDDGKVVNTLFHVTEFRGFEKFCEGRRFWEMPGITSRICGICPVSHLIASGKAGDAVLGVEAPPAAAMLRRMLNWAQIVQSHALSFFHLSGPDLLMGMESDSSSRNVMGLIAENPELAKGGIRLRGFGQDMIRTLSGRSIHPAWVVPGGVRSTLPEEERLRLWEGLPEAFQIAELALKTFKDLLPSFERECRSYGTFPSLYMGLVSLSGELEHYGGLLRMVDAEGNKLEDREPDEAYQQIIGEAVEPWSYLKFPVYKPYGYEAEKGMYRVGPLARLNVCDYVGTERAGKEFEEFRKYGNGVPVQASFLYHYARLIEIIFCLEKIEESLRTFDSEDCFIRSDAGVNRKRGVGISEAPRGTLIHDYEVDQNGVIKQLNLIIATGQNNLAMNRTVKQIAEEYITAKGSELSEGILNRLEHGIRVFDPCLSCSTHAAGQMPLEVQVIGPGGEVRSSVRR